MNSNDKKKKSFEDALFNALKNHGLLLPTNEEQVNDFEKEMGDTLRSLPTELEDCTKYLPKKEKNVQLNSDHINLPRKAFYSKVAFKKGPKKK